MSKNKTKGRLLYEGKTKILYQGIEPGTIVQHFKDVIVLNTEKTESFLGKGALNNQISESIMLRLSEIGINNHFIKSVNMREQLVKAVEMIPIKVVVRNVSAGNFASRMGIDEGIVLPYPIIEFYMKNSALNSAMLNDDHIVAFNWADKFEIEEIKAYTLRINDYLSGLFNGIGIRLVDLKLEFGKYYPDNLETIILADEISPDTCRLWDLRTNESLDKDLFKKGTGDVITAYKEVAKRLRIPSKK